jgi:cytochrome c-type biogenesis protein
VGRLLLAFAGGMVSFLSPCVLPLVPGYLSLMSGVSATQLSTARGADTRALLRSTLLFVAGFTLVFTALGAGASAIGQTLLRNRVVLNQVAGGLIIVMGLFVAGVIAPGFLQRERRFHVLPDSLGVYAPPLMGMAFAFGWTPCIGPALSVVLASAAAQSTLGEGVALLVAYSLGLGVPFVAAGVAFGRLTGAFSWMKRNFRLLNVASGAFLMGFGFLLLTNRLQPMATAMVRFMDSIGLGRLANL